jgi:ribosomal protein S18 acetylase RimI-like enzyme
MSKKKSYGIRWGTNKDLKSIAEIEHTVYGPNENLNIDELKKLKNKKGVIILVAESNMYNMYGYAIYKLNHSNLELFRLTVAPEYQGIGVGGMLITKIISRLNNNRTKIVTAIEDNFTVGHLFLKNFGFHCYKMLWGNNEERDLYLFEYVAPEPAKRG